MTEHHLFRVTIYYKMYYNKFSNDKVLICTNKRFMDTMTYGTQ